MRMRYEGNDFTTVSYTHLSFLFRIADNLYVGPMASYDYVHGKNMERPGLLEGMNLTAANYGVGLSLAYDSRDVLTLSLIHISQSQR